MLAQPCYLLLDGQEPAEASFCETIGRAKDEFVYVHRTDRTKTHYAKLFFVEQQGDDFDPRKPSRWMRLAPRCLTTAGHPLK